MLNISPIPLATNSELQHLTDISFRYGIWIFKYVPTIPRYVVSGISHTQVKNILRNGGYAKRIHGQGYIFIQKIGCVIKEVSSEHMRDYFTRYIESISEPAIFEYRNMAYNIPPEALKETYYRNDHNIFNDTWLEHLEINDEPILKDIENEMYFCFKNVIVRVSENDIITSEYDELNNLCVWEDQIINHEYHPVEDSDDSHFNKFLKNVTKDNEDRLLTMYTAIGYLLHNYNRESEGQAVVFYDEVLTDRNSPMGGTGKGLIVNAIKQVRAVSKIDGKHLDSSNRFRWEQITPGTQVVWLDDVKHDFDFGLLHSNLTDGWTIERKHLSQFSLSPANSPKTVICSNTILKGDGTTNIRRRFEVELSNFYSSKIKTGQEKPIENIHGCIFFSKTSWLKDEWNQFFGVMLNCASLYLQHKLVYTEGINIEMKRFIQATSEEFVSWILSKEFELNVIYKTKEFFGYYCNDCTPGPTFTPRQFTNYLKCYARFKKLSVEIIPSNGVSRFMFTSI